MGFVAVIYLAFGEVVVAEFATEAEAVIYVAEAEEAIDFRSGFVAAKVA